jgi:hypothetical protein
MMHKLTHKAQLSQNRQLTGAATPCLPTIPAEGKLQTSLFVEYYLHVRQPVARLQNGNYRRGGSPRTGAASGMFIREGNKRGPAADAATGRQTGHLQDKRNTRTIIRASVTRKCLTHRARQSVRSNSSVRTCRQGNVFPGCVITTQTTICISWYIVVYHRRVRFVPRNSTTRMQQYCGHTHAPHPDGCTNINVQHWCDKTIAVAVTEQNRTEQVSRGGNTPSLMQNHSNRLGHKCMLIIIIPQITRNKSSHLRFVTRLSETLLQLRIR